MILARRLVEIRFDLGAIAARCEGEYAAHGQEPAWDCVPAATLRNVTPHFWSSMRIPPVAIETQPPRSSFAQAALSLPMDKAVLPARRFG